jgi:hypothetical protein
MTVASKAKAYETTAEKLAAAHKQEDPQTKEVYLFPDVQLDDVRLLEVSGSAPKSGDVLPFHFQPRPDLGIDFSSTVILLSPEEWKDVLAGKLQLPGGWDLAHKKSL